MTIESFNSLTDCEAFKEFEICCGATNWVKRIIASRPIDSKGALLKVAEEIWFSLKSEDWLEAFTHHPKIGDIESLREKFHNTKSISENEQLGVNDASENTLKDLAKSLTTRLNESRSDLITEKAIQRGKP